MLLFAFLESGKNFFLRELYDLVGSLDMPSNRLLNLLQGIETDPAFPEEMGNELDSLALVVVHGV